MVKQQVISGMQLRWRLCVYLVLACARIVGLTLLTHLGIDSPSGVLFLYLAPDCTWEMTCGGEVWLHQEGRILSKM